MGRLPILSSKGTYPFTILLRNMFINIHVRDMSICPPERHIFLLLLWTDGSLSCKTGGTNTHTHIHTPGNSGLPFHDLYLKRGYLVTLDRFRVRTIRPTTRRCTNTLLVKSFLILVPMQCTHCSHSVPQN